MDTIYIENAVRSHPRTQRILSRYPKAHLVPCEYYGEVFNVGSQNFRLQKQRPALILAEKKGQFVLPTPPDYQIGTNQNFYFSHMLNCLYDCRYCFLQGMYRSANYLSFVNFEDFEAELDETISKSGSPSCFFSGYDCDSLAMESMTGFAAHFVPWFAERPDAWLELRTKSINTSVLENTEPAENIIVAFTLTPDVIAREIEHGAPSLERRCNRVRSLTQQGWMVGFRLDPLLPWPGFETLYRDFIDQIFDGVNVEKIHSITLGPMRFPKAMYEKIVKLYPTDPLFALQEMKLREGQMTYPEEIEETLLSSVVAQLREHIGEEKIFRQT